MKKKLIKNIILGILFTLAFVIFALLDKLNKIGFYSRLKDDNETTKIVGILMLVLFSLFVISFLFSIIALVLKKEDLITKALDYLSTTNVIPITLSVFMILDAMFISPVLVSGKSMQETLHDGDYLLINHFKNSYDIGDIIIIDRGVDYDNEDILIIKRVVASEGDVLTVTSSGEVFVNGSLIENREYSGIIEFNNYVLKHNEYYCLGDNRGNSSDSRKYGIFNSSQTCGKVMFSLYPFNLDLTQK